jgi:hypothetical protein
MGASPECFYTAGGSGAIVRALSDLPLRRLGFSGCERAQNTIDIERVFRVQGGLAQ